MPASRHPRELLLELVAAAHVEAQQRPDREAEVGERRRPAPPSSAASVPTLRQQRRDRCTDKRQEDDDRQEWHDALRPFRDKQQHAREHERDHRAHCEPLIGLDPARLDRARPRTRGTRASRQPVDRAVDDAHVERALRPPP